ncbi:MAG: putative Ig domain-containing protein [Rhabdochlamydiaceae bacterium]
MSTLNFNNTNYNPFSLSTNLAQYCREKTKHLYHHLFSTNNSENSICSNTRSYNWKVLTGLSLLATCTAITTYESLTANQDEHTVTPPSFVPEILKTAACAIPIIGRRLLAVSDNNTVAQIPDQVLYEEEQVSRSWMIEDLFKSNWDQGLTISTSTVSGYNLPETLKFSSGRIRRIGNFSFNDLYMIETIYLKHPYLYSFSLEGKFLTVKDYTKGHLSVLDVSDPSDLKLKNRLSLSFQSDKSVFSGDYIEINGNNLYLASYRGMYIIDISNPTDPFIIQRYAYTQNVGSIRGVQADFKRKLFYFCSEINNTNIIFQVFSIQNPYKFQLISNNSFSILPTPSRGYIINANKLACEDVICYGASNNAINVSDPLNVKLIGPHPYMELGIFATIKSGIGYNPNTSTNAVDVIDLRDISNITVYYKKYSLESLDRPNIQISTTRLVDDYLEVYSWLNGVTYISKVDISDPFNLVTRSVYTSTIDTSVGYASVYDKNNYFMPKDGVSYQQPNGGGGYYPAQIISASKGNTLDLKGTIPVGSRGIYTFNITGSTQNKTIGWQTVNINILPAISILNITAPQVIKPNNFFSYSPGSLFSHFNNELISFSAKQTNGSPLPSWLSITPATGQFSGSPTAKDLGQYQITVNAKDAKGASNSMTFSLRVSNGPLVANPIPNQLAVLSRSFSYQIPTNVFSSKESGKMSYKLESSVGDLPHWLTFDPISLTISGTPSSSDGGSLPLILTATDSVGASSSTSFILNVGSETAPILSNPIANQIATVKTAFSYSIPENTFTSAYSDKLTYSVEVVGGSPSWISYDPSTRTLSGTPSYEDTDPFSPKILQVVVKAQAKDSSQSTVFNISVQGTSAVVIALSVLGTVLGLIWKGPPLARSVENYLIAKHKINPKYISSKASDEAFVGESYSHKLSSPKGALHHFIATKNNTIFAGGNHPSWLHYDSKNNTIYSEKIPDECVGETISIRAYDRLRLLNFFGGRIIEQFDLTISPVEKKSLISKEEEDIFLEENPYRRASLDREKNIELQSVKNLSQEI